MKDKLVVAVFENDGLNRFIYQRMFNLQQDHITYFIFDNPEDGIVSAQEITLNVAFIDLHFRGDPFSGLEVASKLKAISSTIVLIAMTTLVQEGDWDRAKQVGFKKLLEKPIPFYDLQKLFSNLDNDT
ncbi:MAG: response regulator [Cyclobacteriaceae bacterium]|nr:response regulator [Cyclobacteriaceae bacterium]